MVLKVDLRCKAITLNWRVESLELFACMQVGSQTFLDGSLSGHSMLAIPGVHLFI